jgi:adenosine deaminase
VRELTGLPKAHLHVHLESCVRDDTLRELAAAHGRTPPVRAGSFGGFRDFADHNALIRACLRSRADFHRVAVEFCADQAAAGVAYAEVTVTAAAHGERLGQPWMPLEAVLAGLAEGGSRYGIECRVILDHSRRRPVQRFRHTWELARSFSEVVAIGVAGEETYPIAPFARICAEARDAGLHLVHHAGETCGPASIREALTLGRAERIGHGIRILADAGLTVEVRDRGVPLEVCPSSNVALGLVPSMARHPLPALLAAGLRVTIGTDIERVIGVTLTDEYAGCATRSG